MNTIAPLMEGKKGLIMGLANDRSIAWGIAKALNAHGAQIAISYQNEALEKRELIKVSVLKNSIDDPREIASVIGERTRSEVIKVIGKKMIFFRQAKKNTKYNLPD